MRSSRPYLVMVFCVVSLLATLPAAADDYYLTLGGGYSPTGNQFSLESNVRYFREVLNESYSQDVHHDLLFADGDDPTPDLQYRDLGDMPRINELLSLVFQQRKEFGYRYRNHELEDVLGPSRLSTLQQWFDDVGSELTPEDRLFIYLTGHGGSSNDKENHPSNTCFLMWESEKMRLQEFVVELDKINEETPVVLVMVQCYSGGFADVIFNGGISDQGTSDANRCGFFATTQTRVAAGCTPDIDEANYREYSSYFWAAIRGSTRVGEPIERPDYNGDGLISFDEAHGYSLITSTSIDISVKTSDAFLRAFSTLESDTHEDLLTADSPYDELYKLASSTERAVLDALSEDLELDVQERAAAAKELGTEIQEEKKAINEDIKQKKSALSRIYREIRKELVLQWPGLSNVWNPRVQEIFADEDESAAVVAMIEGHDRYDDMQRLEEEVAQRMTDKKDTDNRWVRCQRMIRALENVALAANLSTVSTPEVVERYQRLLEAESATFGPLQADDLAAGEG